MATKTRDPIQEERIENVSVPRAEAGAARITVPRRDLLTGAALVLVGSVSGCGPGASGSGTGTSGSGTGSSGCATGKQLRTQFMADFTAAFIGDPTKILDPAPPPQRDPWPDPSRVWPVTGQKLNDIVTDYATFVNVLLTVGYVGAPPPAAPGGSLGDRIGKFLIAQNWPTGTTYPPEYKDELPTVHLVEIGVILDRLLQAMNSFGATSPGGGGSNWPPH
jgi:hypothetical protein